jgi:hypothetical protein
MTEFFVKIPWWLSVLWIAAGLLILLKLISLVCLMSLAIEDGIRTFPIWGSPKAPNKRRRR